MKMFLLLLSLFPLLATAREFKTSFRETKSGLEFSVYELSYPADERPLYVMVQSLDTNEYQDTNFFFKCSGEQVTKQVYESRCIGILKDVNEVDSLGIILQYEASVILSGKTAWNFYGIFNHAEVSFMKSVDDKFIVEGDPHRFIITVKK